MKSFAVNILIIVIIMAVYYFDIFEILTSKYFGWIIALIIFLLFGAALKILGNPFAKDDDDD